VLEGTGFEMTPALYRALFTEEDEREDGEADGEADGDEGEGELNTWPVHPIADIWIEMPEEEYAELRDDIAQFGQKRPVVIYRGALVDGRARLRACQELGVECLYEERRELEGEALINFVWANAHDALSYKSRLDVGARAFAAARQYLLGHPSMVVDGAKWQVDYMRIHSLVPVAHVGDATIRRALDLLRVGDEALIARVESGDLRLGTAHRLAYRASKHGVRVTQSDIRAARLTKGRQVRNPNAVRAKAIHAIAVQTLILDELSSYDIPGRDVAGEWEGELQNSVRTMRTLLNRLRSASSERKEGASGAQRKRSREKMIAPQLGGHQSGRHGNSNGHRNGRSVPVAGERERATNNTKGY
jgi:hypothetical protein